MNRLLHFILLAGICISSLHVHAQFSGPAGVNTGILLWLDGSNVNNTSPGTNPTNGTSLATWKDISGHSNDATVLAGQNTPVLSTSQINGRDVVTFTRTSNVLGTVYNVPGIDIRSTALSQVTILTVYRQGTNVATDWQGVWGDDNGNWDRFFMPRFNNSSSTNDGVVSVGPPTNNVFIANSGTVGTTKLLTAVYDHGVTNGSTIYFNGLAVQSVTDNTDPTDAQTTFRIGFDGDDNPFGGDIAELVVYNRKLSLCEIESINRYFGFKYGVTITTAFITPSPTTYICPGNSTTLTSSAATTYQWLQNGSVIGGATNITYSASAYGKYQVVNGNGTCFDTSAATTVYVGGPVLYVDSSVASSGSGLSWASPLKTVSEALDIANKTSCAVQIWVKKGTYYPMAGTSVATSRDSSLRIIRNNVKLYGGFAGTETLLSQRNAATNLTTLSGDIGVANDSTDNSYHILTIIGTAANTIDSNTVVDGFTIQGGKAENNATFTSNGMMIYRGAGGGINCAGLGAGCNSSPLLENLTFTHNSAEWGGGLYGQAHSSGNASPVVRSCNFINNRANSEGGGVHFYTDGSSGVTSPTIVYCTFTSNTAQFQGGAGWFDGASPSVTNAVINRCTVNSNATDMVNSGSYFGGGFVMYGATSNPTIKNTSFNNNTSPYGGAFATAGPLLNLTLDSSSFTANTCINNGGGIILQGGGMTATNNTFTACKAAAGGGFAAFGGATYSFANCDFINDSVTFYGAGISNGTAIASTVSNTRFINNYGAIVGAIDNPGGNTSSYTKCVFSGNKTGQIGGVMNNYSGTVNFTSCLFANNSTTTTSGTGGGVIHMQGGTTTNFYDCTLSENTTASNSIPNSNAFSIDAGATANVRNTIIWGAAANQVANSGTANYSNSDVEGVAPTAGNINKNPLFVNSSDPDGADNVWGTTDDGLELTLCSPAINTGSNALIPVGLTTDEAGAARIQQTTVDMGAYESSFITPVLPAVTSQPVNATICEGGTTSFATAGIGFGAAYQWQEDQGSGFANITNGGVYSGATSNTLTITGGTATMNGYKYQAVVSGTCSPSATSASATLTVNTLPVVTTPPVNSIICAGNNTSFTVIANGTALTYQWQVDQGSGFINLTNTAPYSNVTAATLNITGASAGLTGNKYRAIVSGTCTPPVTSASATLTVNTAPSIGTQPVNATACSNSTTIFTVGTTGTALTYQWQENNGSGFANLSNAGTYSNVTTSTLTLTNPSATLNGYQYRVVISGTCTPAVTSGAATLTVNTPPAVVTAPVNSIICAGSNTSFTVGATGTALTYQWQVNAGAGYTNIVNTGVYTGATTATLSIAAAPSSMSGYTYRVLVTGTCSPSATSAVATLTVNVSPGIITNPSDKIVCEGATTTFQGVAGGSNLTYQWEANFGPAFVPVNNFAPYSGANTPTLTITGATAGMNGVKYRLTVSGSCPPAVSTTAALLTVNTLPVITSQSATSTNACPTIPVVFSITATGTGISYQWQVNTGSGFVNVLNNTIYSGATTPYLTIMPSVSMAGYQYRAVVNGVCTPPAISAVITMNVYNIAIVSQMSAATACESWPTQIGLRASGGGMLYQWQIKTPSGYSDLQDIPPYSGANTDSLRITSTPGSLNNTIYRCVVKETIFCHLTFYSADIPLSVLQAPQSLPARITTPFFGTAVFSVTNTGSSYQWQENRNDGGGFTDMTDNSPYSGTATNTLTIHPVGFNMDNYQYRCIVNGLCFNPMASQPSTLKVDPALTVNSVVQTEMHSVTVYPNPASGAELNIRFDQLVKGETEVIVLDKLGQVVYKADLDFSQNVTNTIYIGQLAAGVYSLHFMNEKENVNTVTRFTKQ